MFEQIKSASQRLQGYAHQTPVVSSSTLNDMLGAEVFFKCENLQRVGAFKFRGAFNSISQLSEQQKQNGVIAYSSGNHAQAVACVGRLLGVATTIVMPKNAPTIKLAATRGYGATVIEYDPQTETRESVAAEILKDSELTLIPPYDYEHVIAGQGTVAYEFLQSHPDLNAMLVPCGGGGLLSGSAVVCKNASTACQVYGVEPELANDAYLSFKTGKLHKVSNPPTIADGVRTPFLGDITFPLIQEYVDDMITVSEAAIMDAVRFMFYRMKIVVEPAGALGLAALLSKAISTNGKIGVILSGGNIDGTTLSQILAEE